MRANAGRQQAAHTWAERRHASPLRMCAQARASSCAQANTMPPSCSPRSSPLAALRSRSRWARVHRVWLFQQPPLAASAPPLSPSKQTRAASQGGVSGADIQLGSLYFNWDGLVFDATSGSTSVVANVTVSHFSVAQASTAGAVLRCRRAGRGGSEATGVHSADPHRSLPFHACRKTSTPLCSTQPLVMRSSTTSPCVATLSSLAASARGGRPCRRRAWCSAAPRRSWRTRRSLCRCASAGWLACALAAHSCGCFHGDAHVHPPAAAAASPAATARPSTPPSSSRSRASPRCAPPRPPR